MRQLSFLPELNRDPRPPETVNWNLWHGCTKVSEGCRHCYMYRRDEAVGKDPSVVQKTDQFDLPVRILRSGKNKGFYKVPPGSHIFTCFSSDFFHKDAYAWRQEAWDMMKERADCTFFLITKRPERIREHLPCDWGDDYKHITIAVTCENQNTADLRLPIYLSLPLFHHAVMVEPMLGPVDLEPYIRDYLQKDGTPVIRQVSVGGESGEDARVCDYSWVTDLHRQCLEHSISFYYHQTGAKLLKEGKLYRIPRYLQHSQAHQAGLDTE